jgi:hypothetical protein
MMTSEAKKFSERLFGEIEEGRGLEGVAPTPPLNKERNEWIRQAVAGQRSPEWTEEDEPDPGSLSLQMSNWIRSVARPTEDDE